MVEFTEDRILGGKIKLFQPKNGYRVAIDPIILANFINPQAGQKILDVGCGVGTISLILKMKEKLSEITAVDIDEKMCEICRRNSEANSLKIEIINIGIENSALEHKTFDQVATNPPFFEKESARISRSKELANFETIDLVDWITFCFKRLRNGGVFSIIHRTSRIGDILRVLKNLAGAVQITPIFPKNNCEASRVVVCARKSCRSETKILPGIVVHNDDGGYSDVMRKILGG
jgi:tRNA1(Val) A37 N6-methylase TrmN6